MFLPLLLAAAVTQAQGVERRVDYLLSQMTLDEKVRMLGGYESFNIYPLERLGIPSILMSDGPVGVRNYPPSTAFAAGICLAATWDPQLAHEVGGAIGQEARARGVHIMLGPAINIYRVPQNGRNFEYMGEDPFLAGEMAAQYIKGMQATGTMACVKHYAVNNQETDRLTVSADVDERTLNELYLPAFKAAVQKGGAWSVMAAYNKINGLFATENTYLLRDVLKGKWGFQGFVMSDWGATHSVAPCIDAGLDLEMPSGENLSPEAVKDALAKGAVKQADIDDSIRRMLRAIISMGFLDRPQLIPDVTMPRPESREVVLREAREGTVLLKNSKSLLPLDKEKLSSIAVFGPMAHPAVTGGGGSAYVGASDPVSILDAVKTYVGDKASFIPFPERDSLLGVPSSFAGPLKTELFSNRELQGTPALTRQDAQISFDWKQGSPAEGIPADNFSIRWTGKIHVPEEGTAEFATRSDDGARVFLDGKEIVNSWRDQASSMASAKVTFDKAGDHDLMIEYYEAGGHASVRFGWQMLPKITYEKEKEVARKSKVALVCVGLGQSRETEGRDHDFALPEEQVALIRAVSSVNPRTIVIVNSGSGMEMESWLPQVAGVIQAWYPGDVGNKALAEILFGDVNPSGKLPATFLKRWEDSPAFRNYPGSEGHVRYEEGLFVGYRAMGHSPKPLFPFGFGLSYTTFVYENLRVTPASDGGYDVSLSVHNSGDVSGAEVVQVYVQPVRPTVVRPLRELKGFARVELSPGESKLATVHLAPEAFMFYSSEKHDWVSDPGEFEIQAATNAEDVKLKQKVKRR